jgi:hypothetical protein
VYSGRTRSEWSRPDADFARLNRWFRRAISASLGAKPIFSLPSASRQLLPFSGGDCGTSAVAAGPGEAGSSSGMISSDAACFDDWVSARTVGCRERLGATTAALSRLGTDAATETGSLKVCPIFSL